MSSSSEAAALRQAEAGGPRKTDAADPAEAGGSELELKALQCEFTEVQAQAAAQLEALRGHLAAARRRNEALRAELIAARLRSEEQAMPLQQDLARLQAELAALRTRAGSALSVGRPPHEPPRVFTDGRLVGSASASATTVQGTSPAGREGTAELREDGASVSSEATSQSSRQRRDRRLRCSATAARAAFKGRAAPRTEGRAAFEGRAAVQVRLHGGAAPRAEGASAAARGASGTDPPRAVEEGEGEGEEEGGLSKLVRIVSHTSSEVLGATLRQVPGAGAPPPFAAPFAG